MSAKSQVSVEHCFSQAEFDQFARLSGDDNPIHVDTGFARQTRFGRTVAHGLLLCTRLRGLVDQLLPGGRLLEQSVMFNAPTFAEEKMRFSAKEIERVTKGEIIHLHFEFRVTRMSDGIDTCTGNGTVVL